MPRLAALTLLCALLASGEAAAEKLRLCNETSYVLQAATAFKHTGTSRSAGWTRILPGACATADIPEDATAYAHAVSDNAHSGDSVLFDGGERFCIAAPDTNFAVEGRRRCRARGFLEAGFAALNTSDGTRTARFTEKADFGARRAITAGVQRLLGDLGYTTGAIDGFSGARTREAIAAYRLRYRIAGAPEGAALLARLFETAREARAKRGLVFCNKTGHRIWAAVGRTKGGDFESAGWLRIASQACVQAINRPLNDRFYFVYAESTAPQPQIWRGDFPMCTKPVRFEISGRENCTARGFARTDFMKIDTGTARHFEFTFETP